jgi:hypothetical protein
MRSKSSAVVWQGLSNLNTVCFNIGMHYGI